MPYKLSQERFNCEKCGEKITNHNYHLHNRLCDNCCEKYFKEEDEKEIVQLRISLKGIKPEIWRRILIRDNITFHKLHKIIQKIMSWQDYHLYQFPIAGLQITAPYDDIEDVDEEIADSRKTYIGDWLVEGANLDYVYDFGDNWKHKIIIEKFLKPEKSKKYPNCIDGERACPPEDCGGTGGYERFLEILKTGKDPWGGNPEELKAWLRDWDPEKFDLEEINKKLSKLKCPTNYPTQP